MITFTKRVLLKTCSFFVVDWLAHTLVVYLGCAMLGISMGILEVSAIGLGIQIFESITYYIHEIVWENIK